MIAILGNVVACSRCRGTGRVEIVVGLRYRTEHEEMADCDTCAGDGAMLVCGRCGETRPTHPPMTCQAWRGCDE